MCCFFFFFPFFLLFHFPCFSFFFFHLFFHVVFFSSVDIFICILILQFAHEIALPRALELAFTLKDFFVVQFGDDAAVATDMRTPHGG